MTTTPKKSRISGQTNGAEAKEAITYNVNALSRELLIRVFGWLPFQQRHENIPLVCRKWAELTSVPCKSLSYFVFFGQSCEKVSASALCSAYMSGLQALFGSTLA